MERLIMKAKSITTYFPVVCVGDPAGGLEAYIRLLATSVRILPRNSTHI